MYLGIDWGTKRIGLAAGSEIPYELATLPNDETVFDKIKKFCSEESINKIIIGMPIFDSGDEGENAPKIKDFGNRLKKETEIPIYFEPENLTTQAALELLKESGASPEEIEKKIDQTSARLILEQYIANQEDLSQETL